MPALESNISRKGIAYCVEIQIFSGWKIPIRPQRISYAERDVVKPIDSIVAADIASAQGDISVMRESNSQVESSVVSDVLANE